MHTRSNEAARLTGLFKMAVCRAAGVVSEVRGLLQGGADMAESAAQREFGCGLLQSEGQRAG